MEAGTRETTVKDSFVPRTPLRDSENAERFLHNRLSFVSAFVIIIENTLSVLVSARVVFAHSGRAVFAYSGTLGTFPSV